MKAALLQLLFLVTLAFSCLALIPSSPPMKASRLCRTLPTAFENWQGFDIEPGQREKDILAKDTVFERKVYIHQEKRKPPMQASIVFSGTNVSQSIHRPEICLIAQGWEFISEQYRDLPGLLPNGEVYPVKEIICRQPRLQLKEASQDKEVKERGDYEPMLNAGGEPIYDWQMLYYSFVGHEKIVSGHYQRTFSDIWDRMIFGYDQRWAYSTFSSKITGKYAEQGLDLGSYEPLSIEETRESLENFLGRLLPRVIAEPQKGQDQDLIKQQ